MKNMIIFKIVVEDSQILLSASAFNLLQYVLLLEIHEINLASHRSVAGKERGV